MKDITYKQVLNSGGSLTGLELWQDGQYITINFEAGGTHRSGFRWVEVREVVDRLGEKAKKEASMSLANNTSMQEWNEFLGENNETV